MPPLSCAGGGTTLPLSPGPKLVPDWRCTAPPLLNWPGGDTTVPSPNPPIARCSSEPPPNCAGGGTICLCSSPRSEGVVEGNGGGSRSALTLRTEESAQP